MLYVKIRKNLCWVAFCGVIAMPAHAQDTAASSQSPLNLVCKGDATADRIEFQSAHISPSDPMADGATVTSHHIVRDSMPAQTDVTLFDGNDRVRLPESLAPNARSGDNGWFKIKNLKVSDREITGQVTVSFLSSLAIHIDRFTGQIEVSSLHNNFTGQCGKFDPAKQKALF